MEGLYQSTKLSMHMYLLGIYNKLFFEKIGYGIHKLLLCSMEWIFIISTHIQVDYPPQFIEQSLLLVII